MAFTANFAQGLVVLLVLVLLIVLSVGDTLLLLKGRTSGESAVVDPLVVEGDTAP
jgi:hypothetical protein